MCTAHEPCADIATCSSVNADGKHTIKYDDGETEIVTLAAERWRKPGQASPIDADETPLFGRPTQKKPTPTPPPDHDGDDDDETVNKVAKKPRRAIESDDEAEMDCDDTSAVKAPSHTTTAAAGKQCSVSSPASPATSAADEDASAEDSGTSADEVHFCL